ncbi:MAG: cation-translocating P-type ATPase [Candidatus Komeilibacteria bacterium]|nr:cation-translocating P-type ATPase [Candidatus Komeilibacteria bacterium]
MDKILNYFDKALFTILLIPLILFYFHILPLAASEVIFITTSIIGTIPVLINALRSIKERQISVDLLASVALIASLIAKEWTSAAFIGLMLTSARIFGTYTKNKARSSIKGLLKLRPEKAKVKRNQTIIEIPIEQLIIGDLVIAEAGERLPVDGTIIQGEAALDESSLTGESMPVNKKVGDQVYSSTLNESGSLTIRAEKVGKDTTLEKIVQLVEGSQKSKAKIRTLGESFASRYIVITVSAAILIYLITNDSNLVLSLLLVACADDIAVAIPMTFWAAIGYAARRGVIIKGGEFLEGLARVDKIIFDKTGTLTRGQLKVEKIHLFKEFKLADLLSYAAAAECISDHPIAKSIMKYVETEKISFTHPDIFKETPGKGLAVVYDTKKIFSGNLAFIKESKINLEAAELEELEKTEAQGYTVIAIACDDHLVGFLALADELRPESLPVMQQLKQAGVKKLIMLTGDNQKVAERVANKLSLNEYHANLMPQDKLKYIKGVIQKNSTTAMVGDGVNDAAALALADIGISMGAIGSDAAIEAADIALMRDDLREIPEMVRLSHYTLKIARQDFWIWGLVNVIGFTLVFGKIIGPAGAAAYNFVTDFLPLFNSARLFSLHLKLQKKNLNY